MINKPQDLAIMFGLAAIVIVTIGFFVTDIVDEGAEVNQTIYTNIRADAGSSEGLYGAGAESAEAIQGEEGSSDESSETGFIVDGFYSLIKLGKTFAIFKEGANSIVDQLGIDPIYITIIVAMLAISFAVVIYTWIRGNG